jgi:hypothetical protein
MVEKDLILGGEDDGADNIEWYSGGEMIAAACAALDTVEQANPMTKTDKARIERIRRKSIAILDKCIGEMYEVCFPAQKEENLDDEE